MSGEDRELLTQRPTKNGEAYELYLKGRYYVAKRSEEAIFKGRDFFRQAIDKDPTYALAYAGISDTYTLLAAQAAISPRDAYPAALATARKAIDLDPKLAEAHASFAHASFHIGDYQTAEREFTRALALKPNSLPAFINGRQSMRRRWVGTVTPRKCRGKPSSSIHSISRPTHNSHTS